LREKLGVWCNSRGSTIISRLQQKTNNKVWGGGNWDRGQSPRNQKKPKYEVKTKMFKTLTPSFCPKNKPSRPSYKSSHGAWSGSTSQSVTACGLGEKKEKRLQPLRLPPTRLFSRVGANLFPAANKKKGPRNKGNRVMGRVNHDPEEGALGGGNQTGEQHVLNIEPRKRPQQTIKPFWTSFKKKKFRGVGMGGS